MDLLKGKVAVVTGARRGIGRAIMEKFASYGCNLMVIIREPNPAFTEYVKELSSSFGIEIEIFYADFLDEEQVKNVAREIISQKKQIDILVNNAGITRDTLLMRMSDEQFDEVLNTNLKSCFKLCRAAIMPMMKNRYGRIINMASIIGVIGGPGQANYAASKGGMIAMTKSIATEVASRGITANAIAPGFIKTPMTDVLPDELKETYLKQIPAGRFGEPDDIANACVFLASEEAA